MTVHSFSLIPFPAENIPAIEITAQIAREMNRLTVHFLISGETQKIILPAKSKHPGRRDELWMATCFEFFVAIPEEPQYWEFNMSPSEDWNIYLMDAYRRIGFREERSIQQLPFHLKNEPGSLSVDAAVDLSPIIAPGVPIQLGITTVVQTTDGKETFWALAHPKPQADFHLRESFILRL